jgi:hypothetical protein
MGKNSRIGFHAARVAEGTEISAPGNAIIGAYLYQVGIEDFRAITFHQRSPSIQGMAYQACRTPTGSKS